MTELRDIEQDLSRFRGRVIAAALFVLLAFSLLAARLVHLQIFRHEELATQAEANRIAVVPIVPNRGLIVDRHGVVLATNYSAYTLEIDTRSLRGAELEALIDALAEVVDIGPRDRRRFKRMYDEMKGSDSIPIRTRLSDEEVARLTTQRYRFPGADIKARLFRNYPLGETGAHLLGYIGRINQAEKKAMEDWPEEEQGNYKGTEYIGKLGLEQSFEKVLHGSAGFEEVETSASGRAVRRLRSYPPLAGDKLVLSVDIRLQALIEDMFGERRGALVALDPRSGEILAFVSKPSFDPNLFVDGIDVESWRELNESIDKPLLNRALRGTYPPGSTFKPFMAMAALTSGKRSADTVVQDGGSFQFGNHTFRSHGDRGLGPVDMQRSIVKSSNVYYYSLANEMGVDLMHEHLQPYGFGLRTGIDLEGEVTGLLPSTKWKRSHFKKPEQQRWYAGETISLGIGQGYNNFTMLQLAKATATLVSGGQRFTPHLVRGIEDITSGKLKPQGPPALEPLPFADAHTAVIRRALHLVTVEGTATRVFAGAAYASGGKTGTAQAVGIRQNERYNAAKLDEFKRDHSMYIAAAPIDAPKVVLAVVVENAGFGSEAAAPIARRVFDYLLTGQYPSEEDLALTRQGKSGAPVGTPRQAVDVPLPGQLAPVASTPQTAPPPVAAAIAAAAPLITDAEATRTAPRGLR
jgi:penicillin-binding protein 2